MRIEKPIVLIPLCLTFLLFSCSDFGVGKETLATLQIQEASINELHVKEVTLDLNKGDIIEFWNEMNIESTQGDELNLVFTFEQYIDGEKQGGAQIEALNTNPTFNEVKTQINNNLNWRFSGKMDFMKIEQSGKHRFQVILNTSDPNIKVRKAHFIIKK